jgi:hypothetical protein
VKPPTKGPNPRNVWGNGEFVFTSSPTSFLFSLACSVVRQSGTAGWAPDGFRMGFRMEVVELADLLEDADFSSFHALFSFVRVFCRRSVDLSPR